MRAGVWQGASHLHPLLHPPLLLQAPFQLAVLAIALQRDRPALARRQPLLHLGRQRFTGNGRRPLCKVGGCHRRLCCSSRARCTSSWQAWQLMRQQCGPAAGRTQRVQGSSAGSSGSGGEGAVARGGAQQLVLCSPAVQLHASKACSPSAAPARAAGLDNPAVALEAGGPACCHNWNANCAWVVVTACHAAAGSFPARASSAPGQLAAQPAPQRCLASLGRPPQSINTIQPCFGARQPACWPAAAACCRRGRRRASCSRGELHVTVNPLPVRPAL